MYFGNLYDLNELAEKTLFQRVYFSHGFDMQDWNIRD